MIRRLRPVSIPFLIVPVSLLSVVLLVTRGAFSSQNAGSSVDSINHIEDKMRQFAANLVSLKASFQQQREFTQIGITDPEERGELWLQRGEGSWNARFEVLGNDSRIAVLKNGAFIYYQPRLKQAIVGRLENTSKANREAGFLGFLLTDWAELRAEYEFETRPTASDEYKHLRLRARPDSSSFYREVDLWISTRHWLPLRQRLVEPNGNIQHVTIEVQDLNPTLDDEIFELELPRDVKRIRS